MRFIPTRSNAFVDVRSLLAFSFIIILSLFLPVNAQEINASEEIFQKGISDYETGNYESAIERLKAAITSVSGCQEVALSKAAEDAVSAMESLFGKTEDVKCDSINKINLWKAHFILALSYLKVESSSEALNEIENAKSVDFERRPDSEKYSKEIVSLFDTAQESTMVLTTENPDKSNLQKGINEYVSGDYKTALSTLRDVITAGGEPNCINIEDPLLAMQCVENGSSELWGAHFYRGMSFFIQGENKQAIEEFIAAKAVDGTSQPDTEIFSPKITNIYDSDLIVRLECLEKYGNLTCIPDDKPNCKEGDDDCDIWKWYHYVGIAVLVGAAAGGDDSGSGSGGGTGGGGSPDEETIIVTW